MAGNRRYPRELRERAVALVLQYEREQGEPRGAMARVARDLGVHKEALRHWVKQAKVSQAAAGEVVPVPESSEAKDARIRELEARNRELERANQILKAASAFFAREMDPPPPKW
ncbi:transposase [Nocardia pseudovaccinii]|uniref:transposase n=1 Tax=Nocardia pseudovaccinii TaxID=189540 RepID=UPI003D8C217A